MLVFKQLWNYFPKKSEIQGKCRNKQPDSSKPFKDYCAILMSEALIRSGVSTTGAKVKKCWSHQGMKHILLAEEMALWLGRSNIGGLGKLEKSIQILFKKI